MTYLILTPITLGLLITLILYLITRIIHYPRPPSHKDHKNTYPIPHQPHGQTPRRH